MGLFSKEIATMDDLFRHGLKDIFYAENQIVKALPQMINKATNRDLSKGLSQHLEETKKQIERLEQVFRLLGEEPKAVKCPAINGLIDEADEVAGEVDDKNVLDAAIVGSAQAVEHYEMARYGTLIAWAEELGRDDIAPVEHQSQGREGGGQEAVDDRRAQGRQPQGRQLTAWPRFARRGEVRFAARGCCLRG